MLRYRDLPFLAALLIAGYFVYFTSPGLTAHFAPDDLQNMFGYWNRGVWQLLKANLLVTTSYYRPMGGLFYLPVFAMFGLNPLPYRIVIFVLLLVNVWLLYCLARRLTGSREGAAFSTLIGCFHANAAGAYYSTAVVYEVLCFGFIAGALLYYLRARQDGRALSPAQMVVLLFLTAGALNSKEMGVVIAPALLLYEIAYRVRAWRGPPFAELLPILMVGLLTAAYILAKFFGRGTLTHIESYRPVFTISRYLETMQAYAGDLLLWGEPLRVVGVAVFWLALFVVAGFMRRPAMWFGAGFALVALLPVNFLPVREGFVLYIPLTGFGVYAGSLITGLLDRVAHGELRAQAGTLAFSICAVAVFLIHKDPAREVEGALRNAQKATWEVISEFERVNPKFRPGERVLFANTPFEDWDIYFLSKLYAHDRTLQVGITGPGSSLIRGEAHDHFDQEYRFEGTKLTRLK